MKRFAWILSLSAAVALAAPSWAGAQGRGEQRPAQDSIPAQYQPPAGMCRIWIDGVAPARQAAPTDCASAVRNRPPNGRVVFGPSLPRKNERGPERRGSPRPTPPAAEGSSSADPSRRPAVPGRGRPPSA